MCGKVGTWFLGMGGKSSPNSLGRCAASIGRVVSSSATTSFFAEIYVDDLSLASGGSLEARSHTFTVALLAVAVLAWDKVSLGDRVMWIGAHLSVEHFGLSGAIPKDKLHAPARPDVPVPVSHSCTKGRSSVILREADVCGWDGPNAPSLRWHGLGFGLKFPSAVGARPLSALPGGTLVGAGSSLRGSRQGPSAHSIVSPR